MGAGAFVSGVMSTGRLAGRRIVVTRPRDRAGSLVEALEAEGAEVVRFPTIEVTESEEAAGIAGSGTLDAEYDWIIFTSAYAVRALGEAAARSGAGCRVACVGRATSAAAVEQGWRVALVPEVGTGEGLAEALVEAGVGVGSRILFPRAADARDAMPAALRRAGAAVEEVVVYRKSTPGAGGGPGGAQASLGAVDLVTFTSPSTVRGFVSLLGAACRSVPAVAIGPTTAAAARKAGLTVAGVAGDPTVEGLTRAVVRVFEDQGQP